MLLKRSKSIRASGRNVRSNRRGYHLFEVSERAPSICKTCERVCLGLLHRTVARQNQRLLILFQLRNLGTHNNDPARFQSVAARTGRPPVRCIQRWSGAGTFRPSQHVHRPEHPIDIHRTRWRALLSRRSRRGRRYNPPAINEKAMQSEPGELGFFSGRRSFS
jgi:hypothetical protein